METQILYNGANPFAGLSPMPLVGKSDGMVRFHDRWAVKSNLTLAGSITGICTNAFSDLISKQQQLIRNFSEDFKSLTILEGGTTIYTAPYVTIDSINFDSNQYVKLLPYTINLSCYQSNIFSGVYGISEPTNQISWSEAEDGTVTINRSIGAKGFNTSSTNRTNNALTNAKSWVQAITGYNSSFFAESLPAFITSPQVTPCIKEVRENVDRLAATYSVEETYRYDPKSRLAYMLKYSTEFGYDDNEGIFEASINGTIEGCPSSPISDIRTAYRNLNLYNITNYEFRKNYVDAPNLNPEFLTESVNENQSKKIIEFSKSWDSDPRGLVLFEYSITSEYNYLEDIRTISLQGTISARNSQKVRWERVKEYYSNLNIYNIAQDFYYSRGYPYNLVKFPASYTATENMFEGTISIDASYTDKINPPDGFDDADYSITIKPSINQYVPVPVLCGNYYIINLNALTRAEISVGGNLTSLTAATKVPEVRNFANKLLLDYLPVNSRRVVKEERVDYQKIAQGFTHEFSRSESYKGEEFTI